MRPIDKIIIHCSATKPSMDWGAKEIRKVHVEQNGWSDIGYHYVIKRDGTIENGRPVKEVGAHVRGYNANSIGVCLIGGIDNNMKPEANFTEAQGDALDSLLDLLLGSHKSISKIYGHRDLDKRKACPSFNVDTWVKSHKFELK